MNQKYFIILFTLLLIHIEKTHGCHPSGNSCNAGTNAEIQDVTWLPDSKLNITIFVPNESYIHNFPEAIGHFTFDNNAGVNYRFLKDPVFFNGHHCTDKGSNELNPYTTTWNYDPSIKPISGEKIDVKLSIYWQCDSQIGSSVVCCSGDYVFHSVVP